jgi:toxin ParE1/3/4
MRGFRYSARADADMVGIARFSLNRFGETQTEKYLQRIEAAITHATQHPNARRGRPELGAGVYSVRCVSHVAYMVEQDGAWVVIAVLHGRMDPAQRLGPND